MAATFPFDPADDFLLFDGLETITYLTRVAGEDFVETTGVKALRHRPDSVDADMSGEIPEIFHIAQKQVPFEMKPRDEIQDAENVRYVVVSAELQSFASRYMIQAKRSRGTIPNSLLALTDNTGILLYGN